MLTGTDAIARFGAALRLHLCGDQRRGHRHGHGRRDASPGDRPFFTTKAAEKGTGLGLSMVQGFAAQSGGVLRLESVPGEGTKATIILPQSTAEPAARPTRPPVERHAGRILLVDDDERVRPVVADVLKSANFTVVEAGSVAEARGRIADGHAFDAAVTDYFMPGGTGAELIQELRKADAGFPIMLITCFADAAADVPHDVPNSRSRSGPPN